LPTSFGSKLEKAFGQYGQLCVGIDPHAALLTDWGLSDDVAGLRDFAMRSLDAAAGRVGIIKPQVSFFERHGSAGFAVLEELAQQAQKTDLLVIMDAKRGDIGTTMDAYFDAWLGRTAPFVCDALTVSPYLGFDSLLPLMSECVERGKGMIVLSATSNPEGAGLQKASVNGNTVAKQIWDGLGKINQVTASAGDVLGSFGAVIGATLNLPAFGLGDVQLGQTTAATPILAPGFGAQGAELGDVSRLFGAGAKQVIASVSRSVLRAGADGMAKAIDAAKIELATGIQA
jgi:orotidine-5'-phosphate decarboxylase